MRLIYIAGPYNAMTPVGIRKNIAKAEEAAIELWALGWSVICPHKNISGFEKYESTHDVDYDTWLQGDLEQVRRCDAIFMLNGWEVSNGAIMERKEAMLYRIGIFYQKDGYPEPGVLG